jgi:transcriptional regulator with XRE-family HTH domain
MTFGQRLTIARKNKDWTQTDLGTAVGTSRDIIGKYERDEINPSIEVAAKIADALDTSLDYLVRGIDPNNTGAASAGLSSQILQQLTKLEKLTQPDKEHVFAVIEAFNAKVKLQSIIE